MTSDPVNNRPCILFVTGRLAEPALRAIVSRMAAEKGFDYEIAVPGIQVAALLHSSLLLRRLTVPDHIDRVVLPGWCQGDLTELEQRFGRPFERGPKDLADLPDFFGLGRQRTADLSSYSIEIIAEINHATQMPLPEILAAARSLASAGANVIDIGAVPGFSSPRIGEIVAAVRDEGLRVSIDSFDRFEVEQAVRAGAELILSCNHSNVDWVAGLGVEVVAIPDMPNDPDSLDRLIERLQAENALFRLDPIIEPIGMGFAESLQRYFRVRQKYPDIPLMMGTGNITELTEVDSAGVNFVLAAICEETGIQSVLTTQVINWCRSSVAELDAARRLLRFAVMSHTIPKHLDSRLVMLRDAQLKPWSAESLRQLADSLTDPGFRIYAEDGLLHLMNCQGYWSGSDPFQLFERALQVSRQRSEASDRQPSGIDSSHAFYLGYEMARAEIALHLGKQFTQDGPLAWGLLGSIGQSGHISSSSDSLP